MLPSLRLVLVQGRHHDTDAAVTARRTDGTLVHVR